MKMREKQMESARAMPQWRMRPRIVTAMIMLMVAAAITRPARSDDFPSRIIKVIVPLPAGSAPDVEARFLAEKVGAMLNRQYHQGVRP
jgi:tripartite-type tricarboxylate transporter receptor subunit TctC